MVRFRCSAAMIAAVAIVGMASVGTSALRAQDGMPAPQPGKRHARPDMLEGLNLTPAQKAQIDSVRARYKKTNEARRAQMQAMRAAHEANDTAAMQKLRDEMMANREEWRKQSEAQHKEIMAVLTPAQRKQLEDRMKAMRERHERMGGKRGDPMGKGDENAPPPPPPPPSTQ